jgi:hypothetical protein
MKLFPDFDTKKRFMKTGLPIIVGLAWSPIIWVVVLNALGPGVFALTASWTVTLVITFFIVFLTTSLLLRLFMRIGTKFYGESN